MSYSDKKFRDDIARFERWIIRRSLVLAGEAVARRVYVKPVEVKAHTRAGHYRTVIKINKKRK